MNIIITGTGRGIGRELVKLFNKKNGNHILALSQNMEKLEHLQHFCKEQNPKNKFDFIPCDLANLPENMTEKVQNIMKHTDILINNAGLLINKPFRELSHSEIAHIFKVNVIGVAELIKYLLPLLENSKKPHVVNIGSMGGFQGSSKF
jgi:3-oxoacyl-[acyl-carrier protein] reductase